MRIHPYANLLPMMNAEEFAALKADIAANGLLEPIWTFQGKIIDGRNRFRVCKEVGEKPRYREFHENGTSLLSFITSLNVHRRHLSASQRAAYAAQVLPMFQKEARQRQLAGLKRGAKAPVQEILPERSDSGEARELAAKMFRTSGKYVSEAHSLRTQSPKLFQRVLSGEITVMGAKRELLRRMRHTTRLPKGVYNVIYADPPWQYKEKNNFMDWNSPENHYPTMTVDEICALDVRSITAKNAVLFLWVTSPILAEAFQVIETWGFQYRSSFVWDKVQQNYGNYNSMRHEFLLVCVRGAFLPVKPMRFDSVVSLQRTKSHSEKPEIFRQMIEQLYPNGRRIELFARKKVAGWDTWGNEISMLPARRVKSAAG